jgi:acetylornithine deacetylase/succinyl-diaminopimelate desuccinylase-like protein
MAKRIVLPLLILSGFFAPPLGAADLRSAVESYVERNQRRIVAELVELLSIPNVAADRENIARNTEYLRRMLEKRGFAAEILPTAGNPLVYGEIRTPGATRTLMFYAHYDGQPVDRSGWKQADPFRPVMRAGRLEDNAREIPDFLRLDRYEPDWRLYGRSASDDKSPIVALCAALDAVREAGLRPGGNIRVVLDGEEEAGSQSITAAIDRYREKFRADTLLILDGPVHPSGRPTLNFGARGIVTLELTVYGPKQALHSGHYGNWVPNPALRLAQLLSSMKDERGRVVVEGFYDGIPPLSAEERRLLLAVPDDEQELRRLFGFAEADAVAATLQEALQYPSLNIRGLRSAYVGGEARTIIPPEATAALDIRLVKETPGDELADKVLAHIRRQGYHIVDREPDDAARARYPKIVRVQRSRPTEAYRTEMDLPESRAVIRALQAVWGAEPVCIRTSGGTVPISQFIKALGFPAVSVPTVNFDNNQHGENENLRLGHFYRAVVTMAALLTMELPEH